MPGPYTDPTEKMLADERASRDDILVRLADLLKQATTERTHYYVASCVRDAIAEIGALRMQVARLTPRDLG